MGRVREGCLKRVPGISPHPNPPLRGEGARRRHGWTAGKWSSFGAGGCNFYIEMTRPRVNLLPSSAVTAERWQRTMSAMNTPVLRRLAALVIAVPALVTPGIAQEPAPRSFPIAEVLRQPLPAENLALHESEAEFTIEGPTFSYTVDRGTGMISALDVRRDGKQLLQAPAPAKLRLDGYSLTREGVQSATTKVQSADPGKVVLNTAGELKGTPLLPFALETTFFSDGIVVTRVTVTPTADLAIADSIEYVAEFSGALNRYMHKCHERYDSDAGGAMLPLPAVGAQVDFATTTSCLQALSHEAGAAIFTDLGAYHVQPAGLPTATIESKANSVPPHPAGCPRRRGGNALHARSRQAV
jgi:hypothetical protein